MKKSDSIILGTVMALAIASCRNTDDEWITGAENGRTRDTAIGSSHYRYYGGGWFPIRNGFISPSTYQAATLQQISSPGFTPVRTSSAHRGGFGSSAHTSGGS